MTSTQRVTAGVNKVQNRLNDFPNRCCTHIDGPTDCNMAPFVFIMILYILAGTATSVESFPSPISKLKLQSRYFCYGFKRFLHVPKYAFKFLCKYILKFEVLL